MVVVKNGDGTERDRLSAVLQRVDNTDYRSNRRVREQEWLLDYAYAVGQQWLVRGDFGATPASIIEKNSKSRHTANMILPKQLRAIARLEGLGARFVVVPNRPDYESRAAARLADQTHAHLWRLLKMDEVQSDMLWWASCIGVGFMGASWDPRAGTPERVYLHEDRNWPNLDAQFNANLRSRLEEKGRYKDTKPGEVRVEAWDPFTVHFDPDARRGISTGRFMWREFAMHVDEVYEQFGKRVEPSADAIEGAEWYKRALAWMTDGSRGTLLGVTSNMREHVRMVDYIEIPTRARPKGMHMILAGRTVLLAGDNKYAAMGCPIPAVQMDWFPRKSSTHGMGLVGRMRSSQRAYNESRSTIREHGARWCFPPILVPKGSGLTPAKLKGEGIPWPMWEFNASLGPAQFGQAPQLPQSVVADVQQSESEMSSVAAQSDPTNNQAYPSQVRSGNAIGMIQADNNLILTPTSKEFLRAKAAIGTMVLQIAAACYTDERVIQVVGGASDYDVRHMRGADLRGQTTVTVIVGPNPLESIETRQERFMRSVELGIVNLADPMQRITALQTLALGDDHAFVASIVQEVEAEERVIDRMIHEEKYLPAPQPWMNGKIRTMTLERYMNSRAFEQLEEGGMQYNKIRARWQAWTEILAVQAKQELLAAQMMNGAGAAPGRPSAARPTN